MGKVPSMEGRTIARPDEASQAHDPQRESIHSMEGRAIARPDTENGGRLERCHVAFNGGPGNCPARPGVAADGFDGDTLPSMEGRAIARPDHAESASSAGQTARSFNGGPGNCPARRRVSSRVSENRPSMEGRAIARPDISIMQAQRTESPEPSMEGRAIARPDRGSFNGGPGNCPARPVSISASMTPWEPSMEGRAIARPDLPSGQ